MGLHSSLMAKADHLGCRLPRAEAQGKKNKTRLPCPNTLPLSFSFMSLGMCMSGERIIGHTLDYLDVQSYLCARQGFMVKRWQA